MFWHPLCFCRNPLTCLSVHPINFDTIFAGISFHDPQRHWLFLEVLGRVGSACSPAPFVDGPWKSYLCMGFQTTMLLLMVNSIRICASFVPRKNIIHLFACSDELWLAGARTRRSILVTPGSPIYAVWALTDSKWVTPRVWWRVQEPNQNQWLVQHKYRASHFPLPQCRKPISHFRA